MDLKLRDALRNRLMLFDIHEERRREIIAQLEPLIDSEYQELRNYSESMKAQYEDAELEVRRLREIVKQYESFHSKEVRLKELLGR